MVLSVLLLGTVFAGCGGGGNDKPLEPLVSGLANINGETKYPMVAPLYLDGEDWVNGAPGSKIYPVKYGWNDVYFGVRMPTPPATGDSKEFMPTVYNDLDGDGKYDPSEYLGTSDCFIKWSGYFRKWRVYELDGTLRWPDAYAQGGKSNVYIEAEYTRSRSGNPADHGSALDIMKAIQKR